MARRSPQHFTDLRKYDTLVEEAMQAFAEDIAYVITVAESARTVSDKILKKTKT